VRQGAAVACRRAGCLAVGDSTRLILEPHVVFRARPRGGCMGQGNWWGAGATGIRLSYAVALSADGTTLVAGRRMTVMWLGRPGSLHNRQASGGSR
jgi:hypothetical protein